jgi:excinuclease UvrABC helicase subunit UvrB
MNNYCYGDKLNLSIEDTIHESISIKDSQLVYNELKVKTPGLSEKQIKDKLDSIFVMNILKESCVQ